LYWADFYSIGPLAGGIIEANLDGTGAKPIATAEHQIGVAVGGGHLYWTALGGTVVEANLNGTGAKTIATTKHLAAGVGPSGVAVGP
jgi:hypothetical protein